MSDFHPPNLIISQSANPKAAAVEAAPACIERVLNSCGGWPHSETSCLIRPLTWFFVIGEPSLVQNRGSWPVTDTALYLWRIYLNIVHNGQMDTSATEWDLVTMYNSLCSTDLVIQNTIVLNGGELNIDQTRVLQHSILHYCRVLCPSQSSKECQTEYWFPH